MSDLCCHAVVCVWHGGPAQATDTIIVLDGSGSMWGQLAGRHKIEIARDTLSSVLGDASADMNIGMIAYGHREKGACADIETVVPVGPSAQAIPRMITAANDLNPKGKTPLTDAVRLAAQELRYTENAATVVLITDGIETCDADPCALAAELEQSGVDFTTHVVGFGLSDGDGQQVQCLADATGGQYLQASDAAQLGAALQQTITAEALPPVIPASDADFGPLGPIPREVHFLFRDVSGGPLLGARNLRLVLNEADGTTVATDDYALGYPESSSR